jgi:hypothetical protein
MSGFEKLLRGSGQVGPRKPPRVISLKPSAWADSWKDKPQGPIDIGIRRVAEEDIQAAKSEAARICAEIVTSGADEDDRVSAYNDALIRVAAARGTSSPVDVSAPFFVMGEDEIREKMTPEGVRALWDAINALHIADSPLLPEIGNEGFGQLIAIWDREVAFDYLPPGGAAQIGRLLEHVRQELEIAEALAAHDGHLVAAG